MKLQEVSETEKKQYNQFVASQQTGSFLQSWEWGEWQQSLGRGVKRYFIYDNNNNNTIGTIQLIKMPLPFGKYYLYAPYGPVEVSQKGEVCSVKFFEQLKQKYPDAVFIRIEPKSAFSSGHLAIRKTQNIQPGKTLVVNLTKPEEVLLSEMHHKTRYNIKLAQKHGVKIKDEFDISIGHGLYFDEAIKLIIETSKRQKFNTFSTNYYQKIVDFFAVKNKGEVSLHVYKAIFQNQLLSSAIMVDFGKARTFLFGGSSDFHKNVMAPYLMHWQAILDAKRQGLNYYDFWGIETASGETPGFVRFKLGFGGEEKSYNGACDIVLNKPFYKTYQLLRATNRALKKISLG